MREFFFFVFSTTNLSAQALLSAADSEQQEKAIYRQRAKKNPSIDGYGFATCTVRDHNIEVISGLK